MGRVMRLYACAILLERQRILLGKRAPHRRANADKWDVIGGLVETGETVAQALQRELGEELGIVATAWNELCDVLDAGPEARGSATYRMHIVHHWSGEPVLANHEHTELAWFTIPDACALPDLALDEYRAVFRQVTTP